jgi:ABC-type transporter Mla subunit MlaD
MMRVAALASLLAIFACGPPAFVVHVTFQGEVDVARGAPVIYEGVQVGHVESIALRQDSPTRAAQIAVTLAIVDETVVLRTDDRFHLAELRGVPVVRVEPSPESSGPLAAGATVAGVPPLVTRMEASLGEVLDSIGAVMLQATDAALEALEEGDSSHAESHSSRAPTPTPAPSQDQAEPDAAGEDPATRR